MEVEVWPDNWTAFGLFHRMSTQWNTSMSGCTGLKYESLYPLLDRAATCPEEWEELFDDVQVMESEVLKQMHESKPER